MAQFNTHKNKSYTYRNAGECPEYQNETLFGCVPESEGWALNVVAIIIGSVAVGYIAYKVIKRKKTTK
jgi:hypothetical protein